MAGPADSSLTASAMASISGQSTSKPSTDKSKSTTLFNDNQLQGIGSPKNSCLPSRHANRSAGAQSLSHRLFNWLARLSGLGNRMGTGMFPMGRDPWRISAAPVRKTVITGPGWKTHLRRPALQNLEITFTFVDEGKHPIEMQVKTPSPRGITHGRIPALSESKTKWGFVNSIGARRKRAMESRPHRSRAAS